MDQKNKNTNSPPSWYNKLLNEMIAIRNAVHLIQNHITAQEMRQHRRSPSVQSTRKRPATSMPEETKKQNQPCWYHRNFGVVTDPRNCDGSCGFLPPMVPMAKQNAKKPATTKPDYVPARIATRPNKP